MQRPFCDERTVSVFSEEQLQILVHCGDAGDAEVFDQHIGHVRREEGRKRRSEVNILHSEGEQGEQDDDGLLLVPGNVERQRELIDVVEPEDLLQLERDQSQLYLYFAQPAVRITTSFGRRFANSA